MTPGLKMQWLTADYKGRQGNLRGRSPEISTDFDTETRKDDS